MSRPIYDLLTIDILVECNFFSGGRSTYVMVTFADICFFFMGVNETLPAYAASTL